MLVLKRRERFGRSLNGAHSVHSHHGDLNMIVHSPSSYPLLSYSYT